MLEHPSNSRIQACERLEPGTLVRLVSAVGIGRELPRPTSINRDDPAQGRFRGALDDPEPKRAARVWVRLRRLPQSTTDVLE